MSCVKYRFNILQYLIIIVLLILSVVHSFEFTFLIFSDKLLSMLLNGAKIALLIH